MWKSFMSRRLWVVLIGGVFFSTLVADARQRPSFRLGVDLVTLSVSVTGDKGRHVSGLDAGDFIVLEDGRPQQLTYFSRATTGLSVSLLIDSSASMEDQLPLAQKAALDFIARLRSGDVVQIVDFDNRVNVLQPFTRERRALEDAIQRLSAGGSTSLYNAVYIALRDLDALRASAIDEVRREVVVVLSDGEDTSSLVEFEQVMDLAQRSHTVIYTIGLGVGAPGPRVKPMSGEFALRRMAQDTGGRLFAPRNASDLSGVYTEIADELTNQYVLGYLSNNAQLDGRWRQLTVRVREPNLQARTRTGYFAALSRPPPR